MTKYIASKKIEEIITQFSITKDKVIYYYKSKNDEIVIFTNDGIITNRFNSLLYIPYEAIYSTTIEVSDDDCMIILKPNLNNQEINTIEKTLDFKQIKEAVEVDKGLIILEEIKCNSQECNSIKKIFKNNNIRIEKIKNTKKPSKLMIIFKIIFFPFFILRKISKLIGSENWMKINYFLYVVYISAIIGKFLPENLFLSYLQIDKIKRIIFIINLVHFIYWEYKLDLYQEDNYPEIVKSRSRLFQVVGTLIEIYRNSHPEDKTYSKYIFNNRIVFFLLIIRNFF